MYEISTPVIDMAPVGRRTRNLSQCETRHSISLISYAGCLGLSPVISAQFTLEMCVAAWNW